MSESDTLTCSFHDWAALRAQMAFVFDCAIPDGTSDGVYERHGEYSAWLIRKGEVKIRAGNSAISAREGQWLFCFAQTLEQHLSRDVHLLSVRLSNSWPQGDLLFRGEPFLVVDAVEIPQLEALAMQMIHDVQMPSWESTTPAFTFYWKTRVTYSGYLQHQEHLLEWMKEMFCILTARGWELQIPGGLDSRLAHVLNAVDAMPFHVPFDDQELVRISGLTIGQLNRMCLRAYNLTLYGYWEHRRVEQAKLMLGQRGSSIKETASYLGFSQLSHFSAWFKRHVGRAPREFVKYPEI